MKTAFRGVSGAAILLGLSGGFHQAWAQQSATSANPAPPNETVSVSAAQQAAAQPPGTIAIDQKDCDPNTPGVQTNCAAEPPPEKVVVVGSLIATTPENSSKPVEVYTADDLKAQGSPSVSEFVRSLTVNYGSDLSFGQASQDVPTGAGFANADLRGLGPNGTLVLMNGRRLASTNGGFGADLNTIPAEALEAVEVLKDGASTTYGAGAVGGVLNFRTRRDIDAPIITLEKVFYDGSDGEYNIDAQTGWVGDAGNVLLSLHYGHVAPLSQLERSFSHLPFNVNPATYSLNSPNPGRYQTSQNFYTATAATGAGTVGVNVASSINDLPGNVGTAATAACQTLGGDLISNLNGSAATGTNTACALYQPYFQDIINENDSYRFYGEVNADLLDSMEFHMDMTYSKGETKRHDIPTASGLNRAMDSSISSTLCALSCNYVIPVQVQTYSQPNLTTAGTGTGTFVRNPFIDDFYARTGVTTTALPTTGALYTAGANWRPFGYGGNALYPSRLKEGKQQRERLLISAGFKGEFQGDTLLGQWLNGIKYDYSAQYNHYLDTNVAPDISVARLQDALLGYGGFGCRATDIVPTDYTSAYTFNRTIGIQSNTAPGTNGCQWFNPFASAYPTSIATGAANPMFNAGNPTLIAGSTARPGGYQNPVDLIDWMTVDRLFETQYQSTTFDATWSSELPGLELPGGKIGWAAGLQWRMTERRNISSTGEPSDERQLNLASCPFPDPLVTSNPAQPIQTLTQRGCTTLVGAFFGSGRHTESDEDSQTLAYYAELQLPVLDNLNFSLSARREDYNGGKVIGDIWGASGKWEIIDNLYVRASYSTNFRAEAALDNEPGQIEIGVETPTRFGSQLQFQNLTVTANDLAPEDDKTFNAGIGWTTDLGEGRLRMSADFFEITIDGEVTTTSTAAVYNNVFGNNTAACQTNRADPATCGQLNVVSGLPTTGQASLPNQFADCNARLVFLVAFNGACTQGVTRASDLAAVLQSTQNGPRRITNGIDYSIDYSQPLFDGNFGVSLTATQNLHYKTQGFDVAGIAFETPQDRLGYVNQSLTVPLVSEWRANATVRWSNEEHSFNVRANYTKGVHDERDPALIPLGVYPAAGSLSAIDQLGTVSMYGVLPEDYVDFDVNYIYTAPFWQDLELRVSVLNITDEDPIATQNRNGYVSGIGNPRGRQIEIGVTKKF